MQQAYHEHVGRYFGLKSKIAVNRARVVSHDVAATYLNSGVAGTGWTGEIPMEDAYVVSAQMKPLVGNELWRNGRLVAKGGFDKREIGVVHLGDRPQAYLPRSYECIQLHVPAKALKALSERTELTPVADLRFASNDRNEPLYQLMEAALPYIANPEDDGRLLFDQLALAALMQLARGFGGARKRRSAKDSPLSAWQLARAKELLGDDLTSDISLDEVAAFCGMPADRFARSFKFATGQPPHRWLKLERLKRAQDLIRAHPDRPLTQIAHECGFADLSHMSRNFVAEAGMAPGEWRARLLD